MPIGLGTCAAPRAVSVDTDLAAGEREHGLQRQLCRDAKGAQVCPGQRTTRDAVASDHGISCGLWELRLACGPAWGSPGQISKAILVSGGPASLRHGAGGEAQQLPSAAGEVWKLHIRGSSVLEDRALC